MARDIHKDSFDEGTKAKLLIFQDYLKEWLPVFLSRKEVIWDTINIFDFFAGPGGDINGYKGTPLIILDELDAYLNNIVHKRLKVNLYFNEFNKTKYDQLNENIFRDKERTRYYSIELDNLDFKESFAKKYAQMERKGCTNLLFLDQNGIKHISEDVFSKIIALKTTDFLFFISSSTIKRFTEHPNIIQHIKMDSKEIEVTPYHHIHRKVLEYYKSLIPMNKKYYLGSFSLKKASGLYGLIFGSGHVLGMEKFLSTCWAIDKERGEANFDIDDDKIIPGQGNLFTGKASVPKKVDYFESDLKEKILSKELKTDKDVYLHALTGGFTPAQSKKIISGLIKDGKIEKCLLDITSKVCKANAKITEIKVK